MSKTNIYPLLLLFFIVFNCSEDNDDNFTPATASEISDFVYQSMNNFYVYKDQVFNASNSGFVSDNAYTDYLNSFSGPEALFESLRYMPSAVDRYSILVSDFLDLEARLQGTSLSNGMSFGLVGIAGSEDIFAYVRYVSPGTNAEAQGVERGMIFNAVDGTILNRSNFGNLLFSDNTTYTINLANYNDNGTPSNTSDDTITSTNTSITLTKQVFTENPILTSRVITMGSDKIGYLMYNGFRFGNTNLTELNNVFANFQSQNVTDLVLDLRYNGGGSVSTAIWLSSMIAGKKDEIMFTEEWNSDIQQLFEDQNPEFLINRFTDEMVKESDGDVIFRQSINSLNLNRVYVLTTRSTASASELVINGLTPYIEVIQIGGNTNGKPQASITLYDSDDFGRDGANPNHNYALQPLVYEAANSEGVSDYYSGLVPNIELSENFGNLGVLGDINEPFLAQAISEITGIASRNNNTVSKYNTTLFEEIADDKFDNPLLNEMFDSNIPRSGIEQ